MKHFFIFGTVFFSVALYMYTLNFKSIFALLVLVHV